MGDTQTPVRLSVEHALEHGEAIEHADAKALLEALAAAERDRGEAEARAEDYRKRWHDSSDARAAAVLVTEKALNQRDAETAHADAAEARLALAAGALDMVAEHLWFHHQRPSGTWENHAKENAYAQVTAALAALAVVEAVRRPRARTGPLRPSGEGVMGTEREQGGVMGAERG
jgi:multidrug efflux pump subunit AcrA (membrane-fusion protein)